MPPTPPSITRDLAHRGWAHLPGAGASGLARALSAIGGAVIQTTDVVVRDGRRLITSDRALDLHTDHHAADFVVWQCVRPSTAGGATVLADAEAAFLSLAPAHQASLERLELFEHRVFPGDREVHPFVERVDDHLRFYCSFWFADDDLDADIRAAFEAFRAAAHGVVVSLRLALGDVLVVDNRRILHGRTAITGSRDRHLVRRWLAR